MEIMQAIVLGVVQGLTEFLPVSSSGHLVIVPWLFKWNDLGPTFDVALHVGTLFALVMYFWRDWLDILKRWREPFLWYIAIGCVPGALVGYKFEKYFDTVFRSPVLISLFMIFIGLLLLAAELYGKKMREMESVNLKDSIFIGCAQALALMPGVSRSGITITAGLFSGLKRETAARFSFLLAMPITFGAALLKFKHVAKEGIPHNEYTTFALGIIAAAITGFFVIKYLLRYLQNHSFYVFVWYRVLFGSAVIAIYYLR
jgi:undecaprenyl-diphosphatase